MVHRGSSTCDHALRRVLVSRIFTAISDNQGLAAAAVGFATALIALLVQLGVRITPEQTAAVLAFVTTLFALVGIVAKVATVPKTPSSTSPSILQVPPAGTVLVTTAAAAAPGPVPADAIIAAPNVNPPQP